MSEYKKCDYNISFDLSDSCFEDLASNEINSRQGKENEKTKINEREKVEQFESNQQAILDISFEFSDSDTFPIEKFAVSLPPASNGNFNFENSKRAHFNKIVCHRFGHYTNAFESGCKTPLGFQWIVS